MSKNYKSGEPILRNMIEALEKIRKYAGNTNANEFAKKEESFDAICIQFAQIGEQVKNLEQSPDRVIQNFADEVDWPAIRGLRNRISHNYVSVDPNQIWQFINQDVGEIEESLRRILKKRYGAD